MLGIQYGNGPVRYVVDNAKGETIGRFNSLAQAKTLIKGVAGWRLYDHEAVASVGSEEDSKYFELFVAEPQNYPHMCKCAALRLRLKKSSCKPIK